MLRNSAKPQLKEASRAKSIYFMTWRWHFYAGLFVIPFMLMLSLTGVVMLFDDEIELARYEATLQVSPQEQMVPVSAQLETVKQVYPDFNVTQFVPAKTADLANRFSIQNQEGSSLIVAVNPYTGDVQGTINRGDSIYELMNSIHGTLLIGDLGDHLIEIAASLGILLLVSGLYLWLPRDNASRAGFLKIRFGNGTRILMRDLHANLGGVLSIVLLFFLISGLSWAGVWGAKMMQAWNTFPTYYSWGEKPESTLTHKGLNHGAAEEMPWNLELAAVPESKDKPAHDHANMEQEVGYAGNHQAMSIDDIILKAELMGFTGYKLFLPRSETGVYTVAANSMGGDISDPRQDRTSHFDQYSGRLLVDVTWQDYTLFAKFMAAGVSLHQGDVSVLNKVLNVVFCLAFILISITGVVMWWIRRPSRSAALGAPPKFQQDGIWKLGLVTLVVLCLAFPMGGLAIVTVLALDWLLFKRVEKLKTALN
ncbi:PepSY-associated TM helix domain-containing protein [Vibrio hyugaensis]|uniref:PepSY-associated TM helix domain-containing protein n=1 Tax=Vibrio hyugaensis TaxID=1534743 RepID=UPI000CE53632|nr:PepSY domain-containing protein [Vibrio hyugaensis]